MIAERECPFCSGRISVVETTTKEQSAAGLVYLASRCVPCNMRVDAAGVGMDIALADFDRMLEKRIGTRPEDHQIRIRPQRGRRR